jgi:biotin carboxyl carrier protein
MARKYDQVKNTNDFLIASIALGMLCAWAVKDGWFPSKSMLKKHPIKVEAKFTYSGIVADVIPDVGSTVVSNSMIISMRSDALDIKQKDFEDDLASARAELDTLDKAWLYDNSPEKKKEVNAKKAKVHLRMNKLKKEIAGVKQVRVTREVRSPAEGEVTEIFVNVGDEVVKGDVAVVVHTKDHFYPFNKSLAIGSFIGALICAIVHIKIR